MRLFAGLLDDAAIFPPGNLPLAQAVTAHLRHRAAPYGELVGPFVVGSAALDDLAPLVADFAPASFPVSVTVPQSQVADAIERAEAIPAVHLVAVEVVLDGPLSLSKGRDIPVYVEIPRDRPRDELLDQLVKEGFDAKLRTGGVRAELHPSDAELAGLVVDVVRAGLSFKATAGLHHAIRNTDPDNGFEQHGFLNLITATGAAIDGAETAEVANLLADRDAGRVVERVRTLDPEVRRTFRSFGTCSIFEPVADLGDLTPELVEERSA